jgi:hypothetical protein
VSAQEADGGGGISLQGPEAAPDSAASGGFGSAIQSHAAVAGGKPGDPLNRQQTNGKNIS